MLKQDESSFRAGTAALAWADGVIDRKARGGEPALPIAERFHALLDVALEWRQAEGRPWDGKPQERLDDLAWRQGEW